MLLERTAEFIQPSSIPIRGGSHIATVYPRGIWFRIIGIDLDGDGRADLSLHRRRSCSSEDCYELRLRGPAGVMVLSRYEWSSPLRRCDE